MTATTPDSHPDSLPAGPDDDIEQAPATPDPGRESVEDTTDEAGDEADAGTGSILEYRTHDGSPLDPPGIEDGVAGTGGVNKAQESVTS